MGAKDSIVATITFVATGMAAVFTYHLIKL